MKRRFLQRFLAVSLSVAVVGTSLPASAADFTDAAAGNTVTEDSFEDQHTDSSSETEEDSGQDSAQIVLTPEAETSEQEESGTGENDQEENISSEDNSDEVEDLTDPSDSELTMEELEISPAKYRRKLQKNLLMKEMLMVRRHQKKILLMISSIIKLRSVDIQVQPKK